MFVQVAAVLMAAFVEPSSRRSAAAMPALNSAASDDAPLPSGQPPRPRLGKVLPFFGKGIPASCDYLCMEEGVCGLVGALHGRRLYEDRKPLLASRRARAAPSSDQGDRPARAVAYVRMSTDHQKCSTENQSEAIQRYADARGIEMSAPTGMPGAAA